jgi:hypothetical protein
MAITDQELEQATARGAATWAAGHAVAARYDQDTARLVVDIHNGVQLAVPVALVEGLAGAAPEALTEVEIEAAGLGLHWPKLDADVYVPALLQGVYGSKTWMAREMGAIGGRSRSTAKATAARTNGRKGGRPRKVG